MSNHIYHTDLVLFDLDMTLVDTSMLQSIRSQRKWSEVYNRTSESQLLYDPKDKEMQELMKFGPKDCAGIVTSSPRAYAERICNYHNINIPILCAYHDTRKHKPHPEPIYYACEQVSINPKKTTYIGDSIIGKSSNVGAGTITCNYDGVNKNKTIIEDNVFIGSNSSLVAPLRIKKNAVIGAGSVITKNVNKNSLALTRVTQVEKKNYKKDKK